MGSEVLPAASQNSVTLSPGNVHWTHGLWIEPTLRRNNFPRSSVKWRLRELLTSYEVLPKISENLNIPRKPLALRTCAARCLLLYLSTISQPTGVFISARVSEFWLFSLHRFHVCLLLSKWRMLRSEEFGLNFASSSTQLQLKPTEC